MLRIKIFIMIYLAKFFYGFSKISTSVIYAQAVHETGDFKSKIFRENNNLFGMRQAKVRKNYATGTKSGHATFKTHNDSIRDYFERQKNFRISAVNDEEFILSTVNSNYAEDKNYLSKWTNLIKTIKTPVSNIYFALLFFFLLFAVLVLRSSTNNNSYKTK